LVTNDLLKTLVKVKNKRKLMREIKKNFKMYDARNYLLEKWDGYLSDVFLFFY